MSDSETLKNACIAHCTSFGEAHQQRWVKEVTPEILSHLYEALGERLKLYAEHYRMPGLIAYYNKLLKDNDGNAQAVIAKIKALGNPEKEVERAERYIASFRQKSEERWQALEDQLNDKRRVAHRSFDEERAVIEASGSYKVSKVTLELITQEKTRLLQKKQDTPLTEEELARIRAEQIVSSIHEVECQLKMRNEIVSGNGGSLAQLFQEEEKQIRKMVKSCQNYDEYTVMERIRDFCDVENLFQTNDLMRELERYSTVEDIAASDLYALEKLIKDKPYNRSTDYEFCLLREETDLEYERIYNSGRHQLESNKFYIRITNSVSEQSQSGQVIEYFVRSKAGGLLEGKLTLDHVRQILGRDSEDAANLIQHMEQGNTQDLESAKDILQRNISKFRDAIYKQLEEARELHKKKNGTLEEMREYDQYESHRKHVGIYQQNADERNKMIQAGFEYVFEHVMKPIAEERARLFLEFRKLSEALAKDKARLDEITKNPPQSRQSCLSCSTEQEKLTRKIQKLESSVELLQKKVDYLSGALERNAKSIKKEKDTDDTPFSSITSLTDECSSYAYPDSAYRQNRTETCEENSGFISVRIEILNQARDYVNNFIRKLVGVILIPLRAILGPCAPESLQKQAFYNTQSVHRLFKAKSDWEKYNERTEKEFGLPLRNLAL